MKDTHIRPECLTDAHLEYLDDLRESAEINMAGAAPKLRDEFPDLTKDQTRGILFYWMNTFAERHPQEGEDGHV